MDAWMQRSQPRTKIHTPITPRKSVPCGRKSYFYIASNPVASPEDQEYGPTPSCVETCDDPEATSCVDGDVDEGEPMEIGCVRPVVFPSEQARRRSLGLCFYCGSTGHFISVCPIRPPRRVPLRVAYAQFCPASRTVVGHIRHPCHHSCSSSKGRPTTETPESTGLTVGSVLPITPIGNQSVAFELIPQKPVVHSSLQPLVPEGTGSQSEKFDSQIAPEPPICVSEAKGIAHSEPGYPQCTEVRPPRLAEQGVSAIHGESDSYSDYEMDPVVCASDGTHILSSHLDEYEASLRQHAEKKKRPGRKRPGKKSLKKPLYVAPESCVSEVPPTRLACVKTDGSWCSWEDYRAFSKRTPKDG